MSFYRLLSVSVAFGLGVMAGLNSALAAEPPGSSQMQRMLREAAFVLLNEGNVRFAGDTPTHPSADAGRRRLTAIEGQAPLVTLLTCSDSRVPAEIIFDRGVGEIFTVRVAGNVADTDEVATIEYGVGHLHTPLLLVMGHTHCGAVGAVAKGSELHGLIPELVDNIRPAVERSRAAGGDADSVIARAIEENVRQSMADIIRRSSIVRDALQSGSVKMAGAVYDIETGKVRWLSDTPDPKPKSTAPSPAPAKPVVAIPGKPVSAPDPSRQSEAVALAAAEALSVLAAAPPRSHVKPSGPPTGAQPESRPHAAAAPSRQSTPSH